MADTPQDVVNRELREFRRYTGDGLPGEPVNAPLPVGDPQSGVHNPKKVNLRKAMLAPVEAAAQSASDAQDAADRAGEARDEAGDAAERAETAAAGVEFPVSYGAAQILTATQRKQARHNIRDPFPTVANLLADTDLGYAEDEPNVVVAEGDIIEAQGFRYEVVAGDAADAHIEIAGGVKLRYIPDGYLVSYQALGAVGGDGAKDTKAYLSFVSLIHEDVAAKGGDSTTPAGGGFTLIAVPADEPYILDWADVPYEDRWITNAVGPRIEGTGTRFKIADGARAGYSVSSGVNGETAHGFYFENCDIPRVVGCILDGNIANLDFGPVDGRANAINFYKCSSPVVDQVVGVNFGTDGIVVSSRVPSEANSSSDLLMLNSHFIGNRRQGMSVISLKRLTAINCKFNDNGLDPYGIAPKAGVDLEPTVNSEIVENMTFISCEMVGNGNNGFVNDNHETRPWQTARVMFLDCTIEDLWCRIPTTQVIGGVVRGQIANFFGTIRDAELDLYDSTSTNALISNAVNSEIAGRMLIERCRINLNLAGGKNGFSINNGGGKTIRDCVINIENAADGAAVNYFGIFDGAGNVMESVEFTESGNTASRFLSSSTAILKNVKTGGSLRIGSLSGRRFAGRENDWTEDSETGSAFSPVSDQSRLTGARTISTYQVRAGQKYLVEASGATVTFNDNVNMTPLSSGNIVLNNGDRAAFFAETNSTVRQIPLWQF